MSRRHPTFLEAALLGEIDGTVDELSTWRGDDGLTDQERLRATTTPEGLPLVLLARRFGLPLDALCELDLAALRASPDDRVAARGIAVLCDRPAELAELLAWVERASGAAATTLAPVGGGPE